MSPMPDAVLERFDAYTRIGKIARNNWVGKRSERYYPTNQPPIDDDKGFLADHKTYTEHSPLHGGYRRAMVRNFSVTDLKRIKTMMEEYIQFIDILLSQIQEEE